MPIVSGGLGLPESGALVAGGLGRSAPPPLGALVAHLQGGGSLGGVLTAEGRLSATLPGYGAVDAVLTAEGILVASLAGAGALSAVLTAGAAPGELTASLIQAPETLHAPVVMLLDGIQYLFMPVLNAQEVMHDPWVIIQALTVDASLQEVSDVQFLEAPAPTFQSQSEPGFIEEQVGASAEGRVPQYEEDADTAASEPPGSQATETNASYQE